ncbi:MAG: hypothetical protein NZV14_02050 [Bryobacteraceae bacterium]|nr:hypothetical protein [Bryobacteraceae bacterium]MDW8376912.1 hypothetical protein [Bryobacterales bacterium]
MTLLRVGFLLVGLLGVSQGEYLNIELDLQDLDCPSCAQFLEKKFSRHPAVERVVFEDEPRVLKLALKPENRLRLMQLFDSVQQSGYALRQVRVVVRGIPDMGLSEPQLRIEGVENVRLTDPQKLLHAVKPGIVELKGLAQLVAHEGQRMAVIEVRSVQQAVAGSKP